MFVSRTSKRKAQQQAQVNADATGTPWAYGTDTDGNWCCERAESAPKNATPKWEIVLPDPILDDHPREGDLGTIPAS